MKGVYLAALFGFLFVLLVLLLVHLLLACCRFRRRGRGFVLGGGNHLGGLLGRQAEYGGVGVREEEGGHESGITRGSSHVAAKGKRLRKFAKVEKCQNLDCARASLRGSWGWALGIHNLLQVLQYPGGEGEVPADGITHREWSFW